MFYKTVHRNTVAASIKPGDKFCLSQDLLDPSKEAWETAMTQWTTDILRGGDAVVVTESRKQVRVPWDTPVTIKSKTPTVLSWALLALLLGGGSIPLGWFLGKILFS